MDNFQWDCNVICWSIHPAALPVRVGRRRPVGVGNQFLQNHFRRSRSNFLNEWMTPKKVRIRIRNNFPDSTSKLKISISSHPKCFKFHDFQFHDFLASSRSFCFYFWWNFGKNWNRWRRRRRRFFAIKPSQSSDLARRQEPSEPLAVLCTVVRVWLKIHSL